MTAEGVLAHRAADLAAIDAVEVPLGLQVGLRVDPRRAGGVPVPTRPNTVLSEAGRSTLWLGPDEWLVTSEDTDPAAVMAELEGALVGTHHAVVDLSANRAVLDLASRAAHDLLATGCSIDLHPRRWRVGHCAQTLFARAPVILEQREGATRIFVRPSYSDYLVDRLLAALVPP